MSSNPTGDVEPARLWNLAVVKFNDGKDSERQIKPGRDATTLANDRVEALNRFKKQRHNGGLVDRIRTTLGAACQAAQVAVQPIGDLLSNVYPPASAIAQALTLVLGGCGGVTDKLDQVEAFYQTTQFFFERLALLEKRMPQQHAFQAPLTRVFVAILDIIEHTEEYVRKGRLIAFGKSLVGRDGGLADSYTEFNNRINDLECTVVVATLGTVTESSRDLKELTGVTHMIYAHLMEMQRTGMTRPTEGRGHSEHTMRVGAQRRSNSGTDSASRNFKILESVLDWLSTGARVSPRHRLDEMKRSHVPGTCVWVDGHQSLSGLLKFDPKNVIRTVCIAGEAGTGRSMLAFYIFGLLKRTLHDDVSKSYVVHFSFSDDYGNTWSFRDMLSFSAIQIAEEDEGFRRKLMELPVDNESKAEAFLEEEVFKERRLYLVLDGIDHCEEILGRLKAISKNYQHSRFVLVTQKTEQFGENAVIKRSKDELRQDLRLFAEARLQAFPSLQRRREARQASIVNTICKNADSFLYVIDALQRSSEGTNSRLADDEMPKTTQDVQKAMFSACVIEGLTRRTQQLQCVWTWMSWSKGLITLGATKRLVKLVSGWAEIQRAENLTDLDIERELNSTLSRIFSLTADIRRDSWHTDQVSEDEDNDDSNLLGFSAASLRTFYRDECAKSMPVSNLSYDPRVLMFRMVGSILTMDDEETSANRELVTYASSFWLEHLGSIETNTLDSDSEEELTIVFPEISRILDNDRALRRVQSAIDVDQVSKPSTGESSLKAVSSFLLKVEEKWRKMENIEASQQVQVEKLRRYRESFCGYLASRHVNIWWTCNTPRDAYTSFRLTHQAILASKANENHPLKSQWEDIEQINFNVSTDEKSGTNPDKISQQIRSVSKAFDMTSNDEKKADRVHQRLKSVWKSKADQQRKHDGERNPEKAARLLVRSMVFRFDHRYQEAISDIQEGLELLRVRDGETGVDSVELRRLRDMEFDMWNRMGRIYFGWAEKKESSSDRNEAFQIALEAFEMAIEVYEHTYNKEPSDDKGTGEKLNMMYQLKAFMEANLGATRRFETSIKSVQNTIDPKHMTLIYFEDMVLGHATWEKWNLIANDLLNIVSEKQLTTSCSTGTHELLQHAANNSGKTGYLMEKYQKAIRDSENDTETLPLNAIRGSWAACIRRSSEYEQKREDVQKLLEAALKPRVWGDIEAISGVSWQMADMLLEEFRLASTGDADEIITVKEMTRGKMKELLQKVQGQVPNFQAELSFVSIPLAIMDRDLGPTAEFKTRTDAIFQACMKSLTDDEVANDKPSLQMLAKLLSLLGLDDDARIAASCQFYRLDGSPPDQDRQVTMADRGVSIRAWRKPKGAPRDTHLLVFCGTCGTIIDQKNLSTKKAFLCLHCANTVLCNSCHYSLHTQKTSDWSLCKPHHSHIEAPANKWFIKVTEMFPGPGEGTDEKKIFQGWLEGLDNKKKDAWKDEAWKTNWPHRNVESCHRKMLVEEKFTAS
ncbi:hypothetical protein B0J13DRAFT_661010 [Dactylonectria estremocensis]|uniref:Nephrocystin 3-like N-terminal domain-containing protein n=1 Tax=Dactylonectria estremocensis TaxID=1079267 RepID=A0A9P9F1Q3_9HYPO|nr:hypothetical protein B0J13DRAFT_661010 [Dactylonectria estremocensis]